MPSDKGDRVVIAVTIGIDIQAALKAAADDQYTTSSTIVRQAVVKYLREYNYLQPRSYDEQSEVVYNAVAKSLAGGGAL